MCLDEFAWHFRSIDDPCQAAKVSHYLFDIMFLSMRAVIAGAEAGTDIKEYAERTLIGFKTKTYC